MPTTSLNTTQRPAGQSTHLNADTSSNNPTTTTSERSSGRVQDILQTDAPSQVRPFNDSDMTQPTREGMQLAGTGGASPLTDVHGGADLGPGAINLATTANALFNGAMSSAIEIEGLKTAINALAGQPGNGALISMAQSRIESLRGQCQLSLKPHEAYLSTLRKQNEQYAHVGGKADRAFLETFSSHFAKAPGSAASLAERTLFFPGSSDGIAAVFRFIKAESLTRGEALPKLAPSFTTSYGGYPEAAEGLGFEQVSSLAERTELPNSNHQKRSPVVMPIVNPNNPLGEYEDPEQLIEKFINPLPDNSVVIVDESGLDWVPGECEKSFFNPSHLNSLSAAKERGIQIFVVKSLTKITNSLGDPRGGLVACLDDQTAQRFKEEQCPQYHSPAALAFYKAFYEDYDNIAVRTQEICTALNKQLRQNITAAVDEVNSSHGTQFKVAFSGVESMPYLCIKVSEQRQPDRHVNASNEDSANDAYIADITAPVSMNGFDALRGDSALANAIFQQCEADKISIRNLSESYYNRNESGPYNAKGSMDGVLRVRVCSDDDAKAFCESLTHGLCNTLGVAGQSSVAKF